MNENYKWKGTSFNSKGIIIEETPIIPKPTHSYEKYTIPGGNGYLAIDNKTFMPITFSLKCHLNIENVNINEIRLWLDGYGALQIDSEKEYIGYISNSITFEKITRFRKFIIQFMLQPLAKAVTPTTIDALSITSFVSNTFTNTNPKITITGTGTLTFNLNSIPFTIYDADGTYVIDCDAKIITKNGINQSMNMSGDFPYVKNGTNNISKNGEISAITIEYSNLYL